MYQMKSNKVAPACKRYQAKKCKANKSRGELDDAFDATGFKRNQRS